MQPTWQTEDGRVKLYRGDCLEVMPGLEDKSVDAVVTDPPYGVNISYNSYDDSKENLIKLVSCFMKEIIRTSNNALVFVSNKNHRVYPEPSWCLCWVELAGNGANPWGFSCWQPIYAYGKDVYLSNRMGGRPDVYMGNGEKSSNNEHPCAKPLKIMKWSVIRASLIDHLILDPFMGSGTTGVACIQTGRRFIGIEIDEKYFEIAKRRIQDALKEKRNELPFMKEVQGEL